MLQDIYFYCAQAFAADEEGRGLAATCCLRLFYHYPQSWHVADAARIFVDCAPPLDSAKGSYEALQKITAADGALKRVDPKLWEQLYALYQAEDARRQVAGAAQELEGEYEEFSKTCDSPLDKIEKKIHSAVRTVLNPEGKLDAAIIAAALKKAAEKGASRERVLFYQDLHAMLTAARVNAVDLKRRNGDAAQVASQAKELENLRRAKDDMDARLSVARRSLADARKRADELPKVQLERDFLKNERAGLKAQYDVLKKRYEDLSQARDFAVVVLVDGDPDMEALLGRNDARQVLAGILQQVLRSYRDMPCRSLAIGASSDGDGDSARFFLLVDRAAREDEFQKARQMLEKKAASGEPGWAATQVSQAKAVAQGLALCDTPGYPYRLVYLTTRKAAFCQGSQAGTIVAELTEKARKRRASISCIHLSGGGEDARPIEELAALADQTDGRYTRVFVDPAERAESADGPKEGPPRGPRYRYQRELLRAIYDALK